MRRLFAVLALVVAACVATPARADGPDFSAFTGYVWYHHATQLWVNADGLVTNYLHSANPAFADITTYAQMTTVAGGVAYGYDLKTRYPVWLILLPYNMVLYENTLDGGGTIYCDADPADTAWYGAPGMVPGPCGT